MNSQAHRSGVIGSVTLRDNALSKRYQCVCKQNDIKGAPGQCDGLARATSARWKHPANKLLVKPLNQSALIVYDQSEGLRKRLDKHLNLFYLCSPADGAPCRMTVSGHIPPPNEPPEDLPDPIQPRDDPFLERLFGTMCRFIYMLPQESFVDLFRRWIEVFHHMADLKPRTHHEWLLASDVTMQHLFAQHSLALGRTKGMRMKQRMQHSKDFITFSKTLHAAQLRYNLVRTRPIA